MSKFGILEKPSAKEFYTRLDRLDHDFSSILESVELKNNKLLQVMQDLENKVEKTVQPQGLKIEKTALGEMLNMQISGVQKSISDFIKQAAQHQNNTKFRDEFNDSVLIFIYGKVKAGKSSLGNFIAQHPEQKNKANFFRYDKAGKRTDQAKLEELGQDGFETKVTEATDTIQGFRIKGLTWIDTPGLHSLTDINGELAKRYVESADLILYITSSDSPARASDTAEIVDLIDNKNKNVCIILSKSDTVEEDELNGELVQVRVGKTNSNRQLQEQHVRDELLSALGKKSNLINGIYSCSTLLAQEGVQGKEEAWQQSNMEVIYQLLTREAVINARQLKEQVPQQRFNGLLNEIVGFSKKEPTEQVTQLLNELKKITEKSSEEAEKLKKSSTAAYTKLRPRIASEVRKQAKEFFDKYGENAATVQQHQAQLSQTLAAGVQNLVESELKQLFQQVIKDFDDALPLNFRIQNMPIFQEKLKEVPIKKNASGLGALLLGGLAMVMTGGLAGLALGAAAGAALGSGMESESIKKIRQGDNREEVIEQLITETEKRVIQQIDESLTHIADEYFGAISSISGELHKQLNDFMEEAHVLRF